MLLKLGDRGEKVKKIQTELGLQPHGLFDKFTEAAIRNYQRKHNLTVDGIVGFQTSAHMFGLDLDSDNRERGYHDKDINIDKYYLSDGEYVDEVTDKNTIFLHHTAGWNDPYQQVRIWERDKRGRVGTQFLIGGVNASTGDKSYDGVIVQCFDDEYWAYHLGDVNRHLHKQSIGIELCNFGWLKIENGRFVTWAGTEVQEDQVIELPEKFRGYKYYHKYSEAQIKSLKKLLEYLSVKHNIDIEEGLQEWVYEKGHYEALAYNSQLRWEGGRGLYSHTNVNKEWKWDVNPQPILMEMIESLITPNKKLA